MKKIVFFSILIGLMACSSSSFAFYNPGSVEAGSSDCNAASQSGYINASVFSGFFMVAEVAAYSNFTSCSGKYPEAYAEITIGGSTQTVRASVSSNGTSDVEYTDVPGTYAYCRVYAACNGFNGDAWALIHS